MARKRENTDESNMFKKNIISPIQENLRHTSQDTSLVLIDNISPQGGAKKEQSSCRSLQKCDKKQNVKVSICTDSDPFWNRTDMENVKEEELSKTLKSINDKYKELFLDLKRLGITDDRLAISFTDQTMNCEEVSMTTMPLIPGPAFPKTTEKWGDKKEPALKD